MDHCEVRWRMPWAQLASFSMAEEVTEMVRGMALCSYRSPRMFCSRVSVLRVPFLVDLADTSSLLSVLMLSLFWWLWCSSALFLILCFWESVASYLLCSYGCVPWSSINRCEFKIPFLPSAPKRGTSNCSGSSKLRAALLEHCMHALSCYMQETGFAV
jgi:hypothetical protein